jgi:tetratricopeptide (TPR) repeat protein
MGSRKKQPAAAPVRSGPVPPLAEGFGSRPETAAGLAAALVPGAIVALVSGRAAASQPPGRLESCGKTQLAVFQASSLWESRGIDLLVWVPATSRASVLSGYVQAAAAVGMDLSGTAESVAARFAAWLRGTSRPWLMVLDDLTNAVDLDGLWPGGQAGRVVITTPEEKVVFAERQAQVLPVGPFSTREALNFLVGRLTEDPDQRHGAIDLAGDLGCDPAALAQAGAVIASSRLSCRDYQQHFAQRQDQLAKHADGERPGAAAVTWTLSVEQADRLSPGGTVHLLLALASLLDGHGIPAAVFTSAAACAYLPDGTRPEQARDALLSLSRTGLVTIDSSVTPPLVRVGSALAAQVRAAMPGWMHDRAVPAAAAALQEVWPETKPQPWLAASLRSCAVSLQRAGGRRLWTADGCHPLFVQAGRSLDEARLTGPAVSYWTDLTAASDRILGSDNPGTLTAGSQLARALLAAGQSIEAVAWSQWVVARRTRMLGPDHPGTIAARVSLGHAMLAARQYDQAIVILREALADCERVRGADHHRTLDARDELAAACLAGGRPEDAIAHYRRTLADRERVQGAQHAGTMATREKLAAAWLAAGKVKDAIAQCKRALADRERALGPDHPDTIAARGACAAAYRAAGKMGNALQLHEQACAGYEQVLGPGHPRTLAERGALADSYYSAGRLMDAIALLRDTLAQCEQALTRADPLTQALRQRLAEMGGG